jgi:carbonic anhydrase
MEFSTNELMHGLLAPSLETAELTGNGFRDMGHDPGSKAGEYIKWLIICDQKQTVIDDVEPVRNHPLVPRRFQVMDSFMTFVPEN